MSGRDVGVAALADIHVGGVPVRGLVLWSLRLDGFPSSSANLGAESRHLDFLLHLEPGDTFADLGGGNGYVAIGLAPAVMPGGSFVVTETTEGALRGARSRAARANLGSALTTALATASETGLTEGCCDAVMSRMAFLLDDASREDITGDLPTKRGRALALHDTTALGRASASDLGTRDSEPASEAGVRTSKLSQLGTRNLDRLPVGRHLATKHHGRLA